MPLASTMADGILAEQAESLWRACEEAYLAAPAERSSAKCFREISGEFPDALPEVQRRLLKLRAKDPNNPWLAYYQASPWWSKQDPKALSIFKEAEEIARRVGDIEAEFQAIRWRVRFHVDHRGDEAAARQDLVRLESVAHRSGDPLKRIQYEVELARALTLLFDDLEQAHYLLSRAEREESFKACRPRGRCDAQERVWLQQMVTTTHALGLYDEERGYLERLEKSTPPSNLRAQAALAYRWAALEATALPTDSTKEKVRDRTREALHLAEEGGNASVLLQSLALLGRLSRGQERLRLLDRCLEQAREDEILRLPCLAARAVAETAEPSPDRVSLFGWLDEAQGLADRAQDPWSLIEVQQARARVHWLLGERLEGFSEGQRWLTVIETQYRRQPARSGRASILAVWKEAFHWLAGNLLHLDASPNATVGPASSTRALDLERAFEIAERSRARTLLEMRDAQPAAAPALSRQMDSLDRTRSQIQRELWGPSQREGMASEADDGELEKKLAEIEDQRRELAHRLASQGPEVGRGPLATIVEVQGALEFDEALISFQYAPSSDLFGFFGGGSWAIVITRTSRDVYRLPGQVLVDAKIDALATAKNLAESHFRRQLYDQLLMDLVQGLPHRIGKLILLADGELHRLPFEILGSAPERPIIKRYRLSYAPSATLWLRWRRGDHRRAERPALVFADPELGFTAKKSQTWLPFLRGEEPGPLPKARKEGRNIVRRLPGSQLLIGEEATESRLFAEDLQSFSILHFAAHARADAAFPERSTIFLAPSAGDDGFLQPHEIEKLNLEGRLVVLGTCESATGHLLRGEGLLSLARSFFAAGARTVIGSRRRIDDAEAAELFDIFYDRLGAGDSVGEALNKAQRERLRGGARPRDWSALIVLGDAELVPFAGGLRGNAAPDLISARRKTSSCRAAYSPAAR